MPVYAALADIHANLDALEAVFADFENKNLEGIWFLGDLLDPGPHPARVFHIMKSVLSNENSVWLSGNHDKSLHWMVNDGSEHVQQEKKCFDTMADLYRESARICCKTVSKEQIAEIANRPTQFLLDGNVRRPNIYFAHGFPDHDEIQASIKYDTHHAPSGRHSGEILRLRQELTPNTNLWIVGHSHRQSAWFFDGKEWSELKSGFGTDLSGRLQACVPSGKTPEILMETSIELTQLTGESLLVMNPGSIGFPRDGTRVQDFNVAKYLLLDFNDDKLKLTFWGVPYLFTDESREIWRKWYPPSLANLLAMNTETTLEENGTA